MGGPRWLCADDDDTYTKQSVDCERKIRHNLASHTVVMSVSSNRHVKDINNTRCSGDLSTVERSPHPALYLSAVVS